MAAPPKPQGKSDVAAPPTPRPGRRRHRSPPISHTHPLSRSPSKFGNRPSSSKRALIVRCEGREIVWFTSCQVQRSLTARQQHCPTSFPATTVVNAQARSRSNCPHRKRHKNVHRRRQVRTVHKQHLCSETPATHTAHFVWRGVGALTRHARQRCRPMDRIERIESNESDRTARLCAVSNGTFTAHTVYLIYAQSHRSEFEDPAKSKIGWPDLGMPGTKSCFKKNLTGWYLLEYQSH